MKRRTPEERGQIVRELLEGRYQVLDTEEKIKFCAFPLMMGGLEQIKKKDIAEIGAVLGDRTKTMGSRELAGVGPLYSEVLLIHKADWTLIATAYNKERERLTKLKV